jgi:cold shock CspA family protein
VGALPLAVDSLLLMAGNQQLGLRDRVGPMSSSLKETADGARHREVVQPRQGLRLHRTADVFVHHSAIDMGGYRTLAENQKVEYTTKQGPKGPQADQVHAV